MFGLYRVRLHKKLRGVINNEKRVKITTVSEESGGQKKKYTMQRAATQKVAPGL